MASSSRQAQSAALQPSGSGGALFAASRSTTQLSPKDDPLQPLRAMADRVGREVEEFATRVDKWHTHGNESEKARYQSTLRMVDGFKDLADATVKQLKEQNDAENRGELRKSVRRRIKNMAEEERGEHGADHSVSFSSIVPSIESGSVPESLRVQELRQWQAEAATWDLLRIIIDHYHPEPGTNIAAEKRSSFATVGGRHRYSPNAEVWDRFLLEDDPAKEKQLVLRWLERTAQNSESDIESITEQLEAESGKDTQTWTSGWLDTKSKIKQVKRLQDTDRPLPADFSGLKNSDRTQDLVTQLDPDAPGRQKRSLEKSDEYYERALWMVCYEMLRRGVPWEEISEWCKDRSEAWRGVSLGVACESHPEGRPNIAGPTVGYLFRRICYYAAKGSRTQYEAAVYGLLSGDLKEVEPVCRSWEDHLYARYNSLLLSRFDEYLLQNHPNRLSQSVLQKFAFQDAVANYGDWKSSSVRVIDLLKEHKATSGLSLLPMKLIQGSIIGQTMEDLFVKVGVAIAVMLQHDNRPTSLVLDPESEPGPQGQSNVVPDGTRKVTAETYYQTLASDPNALRILVHIFIVLRRGLGLFNVDNYAERAAMDNVIAAYIEFLRITRRFQLIPLYAAQLEDERRAHCLARILPDIKNVEDQQGVVQLMNLYNIDPVEVITENYILIANSFKGNDTKPAISRFDMLEPTNEQYEFLWPGKRIKRELPSLDLDADDEAVLASLRWHIHLATEIYATFSVLHSGLMYFLRNGRMGAAMQLTTEMSVETLSLIKTEALCGYAFDYTIPGSEQQDRTQLRPSGGKSTSRAGHSTLYQSNIPSPRQHAEIVTELRENSQVYYQLQQLVTLIMLFRQWREEEDDMIRQRAEGNTKISTKKIKEVFENIESTFEPLLDGFIDNIDDEEGDASLIKQVYIPEVILVYISVVQAAAYFTSRELITKAMDVATIVADSDRAWLQDVFVASDRMPELVDTLARVSTAMLRMSEVEKNRLPAKKRGSKGATVKIWNVNVRN